MPSPQIKVIRVRNLPSSGGGTPGGLNTQLQYNNNGLFGGTGTADNIDHQCVYWDDENKTLVLNGFDGSVGNLLDIKQSAQADYGHIYIDNVPANAVFSFGLNNMFQIKGNGTVLYQAPVNNVTMMSFYRKTNSSPTGNFLRFNDAVGASLFTVDINGNLILCSPTVPGSAGATGTAGQVSWDANFFYVCVATNTWKRAALSTW